MSKLFCFVCACAVFLATSNAVPLHAQTISFEKVIDYQLPYPGLLPDNPLYVFKEMRDNMQVMTAPGPLEKSKAQLQIADKNMAAAVELSAKGKHQLAGERIAKAQQFIAKIIATMTSQATTAKVSQDQRTDFKTTLSKANMKHREAIESLMRNTPSGQVEQLEKLRQKNIELQESISKIR